MGFLLMGGEGAGENFIGKEIRELFLWELCKLLVFSKNFVKNKYSFFARHT